MSKENRLTTNDFELWLTSENWHYFMTITAKHELTRKSARRVAVRFAYNLSRFGRKEPDARYLKGKVFWVSEPHKHKASGWHLHLLVRLPYPSFENWSNDEIFSMLLHEARSAVSGSTWKNSKGVKGLWHRIDIKQYRHTDKAKYCAKYMTKSFTDWDVYKLDKNENEIQYFN